MTLKKTLVLKSDPQEVDRLEALLIELQAEITLSDELYNKLLLTLNEAVTNSIVHGNKLDETKHVTVGLEYDDSYLTCIIEDEGAGFDFTKVPDPLQEENLLKQSGRGVFLIKEYADSASYSDKGAKLTITFKLEE